MCLYSSLFINPKYRANKKNGGVIPPLKDKRYGYISGGCGKCMECMKQKRNGWRARLTEDIKDYDNAKFVTLTFSEESLKDLRMKVGEEGRKLEGYELDNAVAVKAVRLMTKRWVKKHGKSVRRWLITELGGKNGRIHMHGLMYASNEDIEAGWGYGFVYIGQWVNEGTISYITKYLTKVDVEHKGYTPKICTSAGMGAGYIKRNYLKHEYKGADTRMDYRLSDGRKNER